MAYNLEQDINNVDVPQGYKESKYNPLMPQ